jgi:CheY-like chemotaxis protein
MWQCIILWTMAGELVLIVEDNEKNRKLVRDVLQFRGYRTVECERGEDALPLALEESPALVLMDIQLPGINGIEALAQLRADPRTQGIPVMAVTASVMTPDRQRILAAGFDGYHGKPISLKTFVTEVAALVERGRAAPGT